MDFSFYFVVRVGTALCMAFAIFLASRMIGWKGGSHVGDQIVRLQFNPPMRYAGWVMIVMAFAFPAAVIVIAILFPPPHVGHLFGAAFFSLAVMAGGVFVWRETRRGYVDITPERVELYSPWTGSKALEWSRISKAELGPVGWVVLSGPDGSKLTFRPTYWAGLDQLEQAVRRHVAAAAIVTKTLQ